MKNKEFFFFICLLTFLIPNTIHAQAPVSITDDQYNSLKSKLISLGNAAYRKYQYVMKLSGTIFKEKDGNGKTVAPYEIHYDTGSWSTTIPKCLLDPTKYTVLKKDVKNVWNILCDLVIGDITITKADGKTITLKDYVFFASKSTMKEKDASNNWKEDITSDVGEAYSTHGASILGAFPSITSTDGIKPVPYRVAEMEAKANDKANFGYGSLIYKNVPYLVFGLEDSYINQLKYRSDVPNWKSGSDINDAYKEEIKKYFTSKTASVPDYLIPPSKVDFAPEAVPGFQIQISFPGSQLKSITTSDTLIATIDTGAPDLTLKLGADDPQNKKEYKNYFKPDGPWKGWNSYYRNETKTLVNAVVKVNFTGNDCKTYSYTFDVGNDVNISPKSLYATNWNSSAPWPVSQPEFPKHRINLGNTIYQNVTMFYYDIKNKRVGFGFITDGVPQFIKGKSFLAKGERLSGCKTLTSNNNQYQCRVTPEGKVVIEKITLRNNAGSQQIISTQTETWSADLSTRGNGGPDSYLVLQASDGHLCFYTAQAGYRWCGPGSIGGEKAVLEDNGSLVAYDAKGGVKWASGPLPTLSGPPPTLNFTKGKSFLAKGERLSGTKTLTSNNNQYQCRVTPEGRVVIEKITIGNKSGQQIISTQTETWSADLSTRGNGGPDSYLVLQASDGHLCFYTAQAGYRWCGPGSIGGEKAVLEDNGCLVVYNAKGAVNWRSCK